MSRKVLLCLLAAASIAAQAAPVLASISGDAWGVPRQLTFINTDTQAAHSPFSLGDGSIGFTGGLVFLPAVQKFWTICDNGAGSSFLASFDLSGPASLTPSPVTLAPGVWRGLTYASDTDRLYALYSSGAGPFEVKEIKPSANTVTSLFSWPDAGFGGMTWVAPGQLTALFTNALGQFQLHAIDLGSGSVTPFGASFNITMNGGLAWDSTSGAGYFAIGSDPLGNSSLYAITADGSGYGSQFGIGGGHFYGALTQVGNPLTGGDSPSEVPEPSAALLALPGLILIYAARRLNRNSQIQHFEEIP